MTEERATFKHAVALYEALESKSKDGVYVGSKTAAFREIAVSNTYYSVLFRTLHELGCIETVQQGAGNRVSTVRLHRPPTQPGFDEVYRAQITRRLTQSVDVVKLHNRVEQLEGRVPDIDLNRYILSFDERLRELRERVAKLEAEGGR